MAEKSNLFEGQMVMKFVLTAFQGAQVKDIENENGDLEKCVCIPLDRNDLREGNTGKVSCYAFIVPTRNANRYGWTNYIKHKVSPTFAAKMKGLGFSIPYLGNAKPSNYVYYNNNYNKAVEGGKVKAEDYD